MRKQADKWYNDGDFSSLDDCWIRVHGALLCETVWDIYMAPLFFVIKKHQRGVCSLPTSTASAAK
jgi:hypothetical protein